MSMAAELNKRTKALREVLDTCNDALLFRGAGSAADLSSVPEQIRGVQNLRVARGSITPQEDTASLTIPISGYPKAVSICQKEILLQEYSIPCVSYDPFNWKTIAGDGKGIMFYVANGIIRVSTITPVFNGKDMSLSPSLSIFQWLGGSEYLWEAYYWDDLTEQAKTTALGEAITENGITCYGADQSVAVVSYACGENARAYVIPIATGGYRLAILGTGETENFSYADAHPWDGYSDQIYEIFVDRGIATIGNALFCKLSKARSFVSRSPELKTIGDFAFYRCFALETAKGLNMVESVGEHAFQNCAALTSVDLSPRHCTWVQDFATHMSSVEDSVDLSQWGEYDVDFGICANRKLKWGDALEETERTLYSATKIMPCHNPDMQTNYPDIQFGNLPMSGMLFPIYVSSGGCVGLSLYHAYNTVHANDGKACENFREFWFDVLKADGLTSVQTYVDAGKIDPALIYRNGKDATEGYVAGVNVKGGEIFFSLWNFHGGTDRHEILGEMLRRLGWSASEKILTYGAEAKEKIDASLQAGIPVLASVNHMGLNEEYQYNEGDHEVCIIGCDRERNKLTVVDSTGAAGTTGAIYTVAYEDLFYNFEETPGELRNSIRLLTIG